MSYNEAVIIWKFLEDVGILTPNDAVISVEEISGYVCGCVER